VGGCAAQSLTGTFSLTSTLKMRLKGSRREAGSTRLSGKSVFAGCWKGGLARDDVPQPNAGSDAFCSSRMIVTIRRGLFVAFLAIFPFLRPVQAAEPPPTAAITSKSTGSIEISVQVHSPIYAEVDRSSTLSLRLAEALAARGFAITQDRAKAKAVLTFRGEIALLGGPTFSRGVKVAIGDAVEKSLQDAKDSDNLTRSDVVQTAAAVAINSAGLAGAITPFWQGLYLSKMASALGEATGIKAGFNKALTGDPRGICLSKCEDWNKVNQTVYLSIALQDATSKQEIRVLTKLFADAVVPQAVLDHALADGVNAIRLIDALPGGPK